MKICLTSFLFLFFLIQCTTHSKKQEEDKDNNIQINFERIKPHKTSLLDNISFVRLETKDECLIDNINQIEVFNGSIYLLSDLALYLFDLAGNYIKKIEATGNGPVEFISPYSFWIDKEGFVFILDRQLNKLQKYNLDDFEFVETIILPYPSPLGFAKLSEDDLFIYYYPLRQEMGIEKKQLFVTDKSGEIISELLDGSDSGKILHGNSSNFYLQDDDLRFYPFFSNSVYTVRRDTLYNTYKLSFTDNSFLDQDIFTKYDDSGEIMKEIIFGSSNWIRLIYVYETNSYLVVKYYIGQDFYVSIWDKDYDKTVNFKYDDVIDDLGIGGKFPLPIGIYEEQIIGFIHPYNIDMNEVKYSKLEEIRNNISEDDNPILCFYSLKISG